MWSAFPRDSGMPESLLVTVTKVVLKIGTASSSVGARIVKPSWVRPAQLSPIASPASRKPRNIEPESPRKMRAGGRFQRRKPTQAAATTQERRAVSGRPVA